MGVIAAVVGVTSAALVWWTTSQPRGPRPPAALPVRAFLAVLPFANLSGDQTQEYFSDGITEDIIAALGRFPDLSVVGHEAVRRYKTKAPPPGELNRDLGVRYILEGTVRRDGDRVRVTAQLLDAPNGRPLWSDQYDGELKDLFAVQDEITRSVVGALAIKLIGLETERSFAKPTDNLEAYEYVLRGREYLATGTDQATSEARSLFDRAIRLDPAYASAYAALGWTWLLAAEAGWTEFRVDALQKAEHLAAKAIGLDYGNAEAHALLGRVYLNRGQYAAASNEQARALALNPSDAATYAAQGVLLLFTGHPKEAIDPFETAMRLNPGGSRDKFFKAGAGWAYYLVQRYDDAVRVLERDATNSQDDYYIYAGLAAAYAELGRHADASRSAAAVLKAWPFFEVDTFVVQFSGGENQARIGDGLRKAGLK